MALSGVHRCGLCVCCVVFEAVNLARIHICSRARPTGLTVMGEEDVFLTGTVVKWMKTWDYGFIQSGDDDMEEVKDTFVHRKWLVEGAAVDVGTKVKFKRRYDSLRRSFVANEVSPVEGSPRCHDLCGGEEAAAPKPESCAYVCVLWPPPGKDRMRAGGCILDAMVLGWSLMGKRRPCRAGEAPSREGSSRHKRVLLATRDLLKMPMAEMLRTFWEVREIEDVDVSPTLLENCDNRFQRVFTKLRVWELVEFHRVLLLDSDLLVRCNVDELFDLEVPSAMFRGNVNHCPGKVRPRESYYNRVSGELKGGINAGVILLQPSLHIFAEMQKALRDPTHKWHIPTSGPEQDFVTRVFDSALHGMHPKFNWQLHQFRFAVKAAEVQDSDRFCIPSFRQRERNLGGGDSFLWRASK